MTEDEMVGLGKLRMKLDHQLTSLKNKLKMD